MMRNEFKNKTIQIPVTKDYYESFEKFANSKGLSVAAFARLLIAEGFGKEKESHAETVNR